MFVSPELFIRYCAAADDLNSAHFYSGVVDRMSKGSDSATASRPSDRPVIVPEVYSGEQPWEDWIDQFESIAAINGWNEEKKLVWLKVRLTGRALLAFRKFSVTTKASLKNVVVAMQERFEPQSKRDLYLAEFQVSCKKRTETWADYGEDLRILVDKAYPTLDDDARQQLALQRYLSQLQDEQVAFGVKQRKPKTIEAAVAATLELKDSDGGFRCITQARPIINHSNTDEILTTFCGMIVTLALYFSKYTSVFSIYHHHQKTASS